MTTDRTVSILGANGEPLPPSSRALALSGGSGMPYDSSHYEGAHFQEWNPFLWSADGERNLYRDRIAARAKDMVGNDGWAHGAIKSLVDNVIGAMFRPVAKPDYQALQRYTGNKAFDSEWAEEFGKACDAYFRTWAGDVNFYCHAQRKMSFAQMMGVGFRHKSIEGDALALLKWLPDRVGPGRARYATAVQIIDPDRLSNPQLQFDQQALRGGVEVDDEDVAIAYHIRQAHQGDWFSASKAVTWQRIERETSWGRPIIVHDFDMDRAGQHKGGIGVLNPIIKRMKMLLTYDGKALDAAIIAAMFGAYLESPFDPQLMAEAMGAGNSIGDYQKERSSFHDERQIKMGDTKIPILFPGESVKGVSSAHPNENFEAFESTFLRNIAAGTGQSYLQVSKDWRGANYSSARGELLEAWKSILPRRINFGQGFASPIRGAWLEESMDVDDYPLPRNAPPFHECRTEYARCLWMGPGRGVIDKPKEMEGALMSMEIGASTLEIEAAEQGLHWEENLDQRAKEVKAFRDRGLEPPRWAGIEPGNSPSQRQIQTSETA